MAEITAIQSPIYQPARRTISAITQNNPASITTTFAHNYITGEIVRLYVPFGFGMTQANDLTGEITVTGDTTFTIDIDTTTFDYFTAPLAVRKSDNSGPARIITAVTQDNPASVTTQSNHNFSTNDIITLQIPFNYGMVQANGLSAAITVTGDTTFTIAIDTTTFDPFVLDSTLLDQYAQVVPIGENNSILTGAVENTLPSRQR